MKLPMHYTGALCALAMLLIVSSCQQEDVDSVSGPIITQEIKDQFTDLGFDVSDIGLVPAKNELTDQDNGTYNYLLEGDIVITPAQLEQMLESDLAHEGANGEQYRTFNLVSSPQTINVIGYTANNANGLDSKMQTALQWAVNNFNRLNIGLNFTLTFGSNFSPYDMVIYRVSGGGGGSAGFPSGGAPNKFIQIQSGTSNFSTNVVEHVITHEMGHSVGLRHTDYFDRSFSCGSGGNEGSAGVGAVYVPGTPSGIDPNSIMLACFSSSEDGEFGFYDVEALEFLY